MQQEPDIVHHRLGLLGGGGHGDRHGKHRAGGAEVGSGGWVIIQQLMEPSLAGCPSVQLLSGGLVQVGSTDWVLGSGPGGG